METHDLCPVIRGRSLGEEGDNAGKIYPSPESQEQANGGKKAVAPSKGKEAEGRDKSCVPKDEKFPGTEPPEERSGKNKSKAISREYKGEDTPRLAVGDPEFGFYRGQDGGKNSP